MSDHTSDLPQPPSPEPLPDAVPNPDGEAAPVLATEPAAGVPPFGPPLAPPPPFPPFETLPQLRPGHPVLGPSLWTFGALLWAYLVIGECVLSFGLPEAVGFVLVLLAYGIAWLASMPDTAAPANRWQKLAPGVTGLALFITTLFFAATLFGTSRRSHIAGITLLLWFFSATMLLLGRRWTLRAHSRRRLRWPVAGTVVLWVISGLVTLVALVSTLSRA